MMKNEPTVTLYLPENPNEPFVEGCINGTNFRIRTGAVVQVPLRIAKVLETSRRDLLKGRALTACYRTPGGRKLM